MAFRVYLYIYNILLLLLLYVHCDMGFDAQFTHNTIYTFWYYYTSQRETSLLYYALTVFFLYFTLHCSTPHSILFSLHFSFSTLYVSVFFGMSMGFIQPSVREMGIGNSVYMRIRFLFDICWCCMTFMCFERLLCDKN